MDTSLSSHRRPVAAYQQRPSRPLLSGPLALALAGSIAGCGARTIVAPLERLKVLAQTGSLHHKHGYWATARHIARTEGTIGLFRGNLANCLKVGPNKALRFGGYDALRRVMCADPARPSFRENLVCSGAMACVASSVTHPLDTIKTRLCLTQRGITFGTALTQLLHEGGVLRLYAGLPTAMLGTVPFVGVSLALFMQFQQEYRIHAGLPDGAKLPAAPILAASALANVISQAVSYPLYCLKTNQEATREGLWKCARRLVLERGVVGGLYAGVGLTTAKAMPSLCCGFWIYEEAKAMLMGVNQTTSCVR